MWFEYHSSSANNRLEIYTARPLFIGDNAFVPAWVAEHIRHNCKNLGIFHTECSVLQSSKPDNVDTMAVYAEYTIQNSLNITPFNAPSTCSGAQFTLGVVVQGRHGICYQNPFLFYITQRTCRAIIDPSTPSRFCFSRTCNFSIRTRWIGVSHRGTTQSAGGAGSLTTVKMVRAPGFCCDDLCCPSLQNRSQGRPNEETS